MNEQLPASLIPFSFLIWKFLFPEEQTTYISLGSDCNVATILRTHNKRKDAYPFDWCVSLGNIASCFQYNFESWTTMIPKAHPQERITNKYGVFFAHEPNPGAPEPSKQRRRINRLLSLLGSTTQFTHLIRQSHKQAHEGGHPTCSIRMDGPDYSGMERDEITSVLSLDAHFQKMHYTNYHLWLILICPKCFCHSKVANTNPRLTIINLSFPNGKQKDMDNATLNSVVEQCLLTRIIN
jgi:hypothetical protein